jgi:deazaflavin-dependent oxidoreductase (nitroreductase family)
MPISGTYQPSPSKWARDQAELMESSNGTKGITLSGKPVVLLTTVGARTGALRKTPLMRVEHDGSYAVVASRGGAPLNPQWYFNLVANPDVELRDGPMVTEYTAREAIGEERALWWSRAVEVWPAYDDYQKLTKREIPIFVLTPVD